MKFMNKYFIFWEGVPMQSFKVTVNGKVFDVTVDDGIASTPAVAAPVAEKVETEEAPAAAPALKTGNIESGDVPVNAPLAGTILAVKVKPGESVSYGQVLLTLEALKMENEIVAPQAGVVKEILAGTGTSVNVGDILITLRS
jgi:biotin carboxyl carrier protein